MESSGARLKKIRLEKGLSLEEVYKKTKIHLNILKAIEEDNPVNLSPIYIRGFLKIYCKFLGVNPADFISGYKEPQIAETSTTTGSVKEQSVSFLKTATVKLGSFRPSKKIKAVFTIIAVLIVFGIGLFRLGKFLSVKHHSLQGMAKLPAFTPDISKQKKTQASQAQKASAVTAKQKPKGGKVVDVKTTSSGIRLGILAREDCWVTLKADGRIVFHSNLKKGKSESWQAKDKMELSLNNAGAVDLIVNGERISPLGKKGQARKNILITKEGLSVP